MLGSVVTSMGRIQRAQTQHARPLRDKSSMGSSGVYCKQTHGDMRRFDNTYLHRVSRTNRGK